MVVKGFFLLKKEKMSNKRKRIGNETHESKKAKSEQVVIRKAEKQKRGQKEASLIHKVENNHSFSPEDLSFVMQDIDRALKYICNYMPDRLDIAKFLLDHGANPNYGKNYKPLYNPCKWGGDQSNYYLAKLLLEYGADPNYVDSGDWSYLHLSSRDGLTNIVKLLLDHHADPNVCKEKSDSPLTVTGSDSPLTLAVRHGHLEIVEALLEHGAIVNMRTSLFKDTALHNICATNYKNEKSPETRIAIAKLLLEYGGDMNIKDKDGKTPLESKPYHAHQDALVEFFENYLNTR